MWGQVLSACQCCGCAQAGALVGGNLGAVRSLLAHPAFAMSNPNMCYSMFLSFLRSTPTFHAADGSGYEFLADSILQARAVAPRAAVMSAVSLHRLESLLLPGFVSTGACDWFKTDLGRYFKAEL